MNSKTTLTIRIPTILLGAESGEDLIFTATSETEMTANEHEAATDAVFAGLGMLLTMFNLDKSPDIASPAPAGPDQDQEQWTGMRFWEHGWIGYVIDGSPAYLSGIRTGDVIRAIDGMTVCLESHRKWNRSIASTQPGEPLFVDIVCPVSADPAGFKRHVLRRPGPAGEVS